MQTAGNIFSQLHIKQAVAGKLLTTSVETITHSGAMNAATKSAPDFLSRLARGWQLGGRVEQGLGGMKNFKGVRNGLQQITNSITGTAAKNASLARRTAVAPAMLADASRKLADGDLATRIGGGLFKHRMPIGVAAGVGALNEAHTKFVAKPRAMRDGAWQGGQAVINQTANQMANAGFGDRLGFLFNPQGAGQQYADMARQQLAKAMA